MRKWLFEAVKKWKKSGPTMLVLVGPPGAGKTTFLNDLADKEEGCLMVSVRPTLGTNVGLGFWHALLSQLDLQGERLPTTVHASVARAEQVLPPSEGSQRLVLVDSFERGGWLWDAGGLAGLDHPIAGVKVVVACRPGLHLSALHKSGAQIVYLDPQSQENQDDLTRYLKKMGLAADQLEGYLARSDGNFLVASHLVRSGLTTDNSIPHELKTILWVVWRELIQSAQSNNQQELSLVAGLLAETPEPLPSAAIADFLGLSAARVHHLLETLLPILILRDGRYSIFCRAMKVALSELMSRDLVHIHSKVVAFFRETYPSWEEMTDLYGWSHLGYHCDRLARWSRRRDFSILHWLCEGPYIQSKLARTGSVRSVVDDLERGLRAALEESDLPRILAYGLRLPKLRANQASTMTHLLADEGEFEKALDNARLVVDEGCRFKAFLLLAWQAWEEENQDWVEQVLQEALQIPLPRFRDVDLPLVLSILTDFALDERYTEQAFQLLDLEEDPLRLSTYFLGFGRKTRLTNELRVRAFQAGLEVCQKAPEGPGRTLREVALTRALISLGVEMKEPERAPERVDRRVFARAEDPGQSFMNLLGAVSQRPWDPARVNGYLDLADALLEVADEPFVEEAFLKLLQAAVGIQVPAERLRIFYGLCGNLAKLGRSEFTRDAFERLSAIADTFQDDNLRARALAELAVGLHKIRNPRDSQRKISESAKLAFTLTDTQERSETLGFLAGCVARTGHRVRARDLALNSLQAETATGDADQGCRSTIKMALMAASPQTSAEYIQQGADIAEVSDLYGPQAKAATLSTLAHTMSRIGDSEWGLKLLEQAVAAARAMESGSQKAVTLANLATQFGMSGNDEKQRQLLLEAEEAVEGHPAATQAEGQVALATSYHEVHLPDQAHTHLKRAFDQLSKLEALDLLESGALLLAGRLANPTGLEKDLDKLIKRASAALKNLEGSAYDEAQLALLKLELAREHIEAACDRLGKISSLSVGGQGRIELARSVVREHPGLALSSIAEIPVTAQRMEAVRRATLEAFLEVRPSRMNQLRNTLRELTLLATEDQLTTDLVWSLGLLRARPQRAQRDGPKNGLASRRTGAPPLRVPPQRWLLGA